MVLTSVLFMLFAQDSPAGNLREVQDRAAAEGRQLAKKESEPVPVDNRPGHHVSSLVAVGQQAVSAPFDRCSRAQPCIWCLVGCLHGTSDAAWRITRPARSAVQRRKGSKLAARSCWVFGYWVPAVPCCWVSGYWVPAVPLSGSAHADMSQVRDPSTHPSPKAADPYIQVKRASRALVRVHCTAHVPGGMDYGRPAAVTVRQARTVRQAGGSAPLRASWLLEPA